MDDTPFTVEALVRKLQSHAVPEALREWDLHVARCSLVKFEREDFALDPDMTPESLMEEWNRQLKIKKGG